MDRIVFHIDVNSAYLSWEAVARLKAGETVELEVFGDITQLIYITSGECYITTRDKAFMVIEPSLFIPNMDLEKMSFMQ